MQKSQIYQIKGLKKKNNKYDLKDSGISESLNSEGDFKSSDDNEQPSYLNNENISDSSDGSTGTEEDYDKVEEEYEQSEIDLANILQKLLDTLKEKYNLSDSSSDSDDNLAQSHGDDLEKEVQEEKQVEQPKQEVQEIKPAEQPFQSIKVEKQEEQNNFLSGQNVHLKSQSTQIDWLFTFEQNGNTVNPENVARCLKCLKLKDSLMQA